MKAADSNINDIPRKPDSSARENALNRMCHSLEVPENRKRFKAFPEAYCHGYGLTREETHAVTDLDVLRLLRLGGQIQRIALLTSLYGMDVIDIGAEQNDMDVATFRKLLQQEGFLDQH